MIFRQDLKLQTLNYASSFLGVFFVYFYGRMWLSAMGFYEQGYRFSDERTQVVFDGIVCVLPVVILILNIFTIDRQRRLKSLLIWLPVTLVLELVLVFGAFLYGGMYRHHVQELQLENGVTAKIRYGIDNESAHYGTSVWPSMLVLERKMGGGMLVESKMLVSVYPTGGANIELIDGGHKFRFTDNCYKGEKVVRIYDSNWNSRNSHLPERITR